MPIVTLIHLRPENTKAAPQAPLPCPAETRIEGGNKRRAGNGSGARAMPCRFKANSWAGYFDSDRLREKKLFDCPGSQRHNQQQSCRAERPGKAVEPGGRGAGHSQSANQCSRTRSGADTPAVSARTRKSVL